MLSEILWMFRQSLGLLLRWPEYDHNRWGVLGVLVMLAGILFLGFSLWRSCAAKTKRRLLWLLSGLFIAAATLTAGSTAVCHGTHEPRRTAAGLEPAATEATSPVSGAEVLELAGPADAPWGLLVLIGGYGSESPALAEPPSLRQPWQPGPQPDPLPGLFRRRIFVHLHGGFGWTGWEKTEPLGASLSRHLEQRRRELDLEKLPCLLIAHSRGAQVAAAAPVFRTEPGWTRVAVHPPAGVDPLLRLLAGISPEITEIHTLGGKIQFDLLREPGLRASLFPFDAVYQARLWDRTVTRFPAQTGLPLRNLSPIGSHVMPFCRRDTAFWRDLEAELRAPQPFARPGPG